MLIVALASDGHARVRASCLLALSCQRTAAGEVSIGASRLRAISMSVRMPLDCRCAPNARADGRHAVQRLHYSLSAPERAPARTRALVARRGEPGRPAPRAILPVAALRSGPRPLALVFGVAREPALHADHTAARRCLLRWSGCRLAIVANPRLLALWSPAADRPVQLPLAK